MLLTPGSGTVHSGTHLWAACAVGSSSHNTLSADEQEYDSWLHSAPQRSWGCMNLNHGMHVVHIHMVCCCGALQLHVWCVPLMQSLCLGFLYPQQWVPLLDMGLLYVHLCVQVAGCECRLWPSTRAASRPLSPSRLNASFTSAYLQACRGFAGNSGTTGQTRCDSRPPCARRSSHITAGSDLPRCY